MFDDPRWGDDPRDRDDDSRPLGRGPSSAIRDPCDRSRSRDRSGDSDAGNSRKVDLSVMVRGDASVGVSDGLYRYREIDDLARFLSRRSISGGTLATGRLSYQRAIDHLDTACGRWWIVPFDWQALLFLDAAEAAIPRLPGPAGLRLTFRPLKQSRPYHVTLQGALWPPSDGVADAWCPPSDLFFPRLARTTRLRKGEGP